MSIPKTDRFPQPERSDVCVPLQCPIEVYTNRRGGVVIHQTGDYGEDAHIVMNDAVAVRAVIRALEHEIGG